MKATAKCNVNYNGVWYKVGDVFDVADADKTAMADYCEFAKAEAKVEATIVEPVAEEKPKRGRRKKTEE